MNKQQIAIFYDMVCLYEYVGDMTLYQSDMIGDILKLYGNDEVNAINVLFNEEGYHSANLAFIELFGIDTDGLNKLADEFGFKRIKK